MFHDVRVKRFDFYAPIQYVDMTLRRLRYISYVISKEVGFDPNIMFHGISVFLRVLLFAAARRGSADPFRHRRSAQKGSLL